jgi:hypothetical protein
MDLLGGITHMHMQTSGAGNTGFKAYMYQLHPKINLEIEETEEIISASKFSK